MAQSGRLLQDLNGTKLCMCLKNSALPPHYMMDTDDEPHNKNLILSRRAHTQALAFLNELQNKSARNTARLQHLSESLQRASWDFGYVSDKWQILLSWYTR